MTAGSAPPEAPVADGQSPRASKPRGRAGVASLITRKYSINAIRYLSVVLLAAGLWGSWLQPALSQPLRATALTVALPGGRLPLVTWGLILAVAIASAIVGLLPWGRRQAVWTDLAAVFALTSTLGCVMQSVLVDAALQERLAHERTGLAYLQLIVGYRIPRPSLTTLGPIPLPDTAAEVFSALCSGFYLALTGAILLAFVALAQPRMGIVRNVRGRRVVQTGTAAIVIVLAVPVIESVLAGWDVAGAKAASAAGDDNAAVARYESAVDRGNGIDANPDLLAQYGIAQLRLGPADGAAAQLAASRLQLQAGKDLPALETLAAAAGRQPSNTALRDEFTTQAVSYLVRRGAPRPVRALVSDGNDSALLRITLAKYELTTGDNPMAIADARAADDLAADSDVRSVALTLLSVGQSRTGDMLGGRQTLLAAVEADDNSVNVMARSLLTGLYTTVPL